MKSFPTLACVVATMAVCSICSCNRELMLHKNNINRIIAEMTLEEKAHVVVGACLHGDEDSLETLVVSAVQSKVPGAAGTTYPVARLGIPSIVLTDGPSGVRIDPIRDGDSVNTYYCTGFPIGTLIAASWDTRAAYDVGRIMGNEAKSYGVDVILGPGVNIHRNPLCGRNFEYYSEDPLLAGYIGAAAVNGTESTGVGTSVKHFAVNNQEINRLGNDARVDNRTLREIYLRQFEIIVREAQPYTIMSSYNYLNGTYTSESRELLTDVLRDDWGYQGMVVSDWGGGRDVVAQIKAGNDMLQPGTAWQYRTIVEAVRNGSLSESALDSCVRRVLELIVKVPSFKHKADGKPDLEAGCEVTRRVASDGMVLLKNDNKALPVKSESTLALFGTSSYDLITNGTGAGHVYTSHNVGLDKGLCDAGYVIDSLTAASYMKHIESENVRLAEANAKRNWWYGRLHTEEMNAYDSVASAAAQRSDVAIITIGRVSGEGTDRHTTDDFYLKESETAMIEQVSRAFHAVGKPVVVILNVGGVVETASWKSYPDAVLVAWQPGQEGGNSIADVVSGRVCPSGCLPMTFPVSYDDVPSQNFPALNLNTGKNDSFYRYSATKLYEVHDVDYTDYTEGVFVGYRYYNSRRVDVSYPFGYGLSYTAFELGEPQIKATDDGWDVSVEVRNVGSVAGRHVVQLYVSAPAQTMSKPRLELRAFAKTREIAPSDAQCVVMHVSKADLASFDAEQSAWVTEAGDYTFCIADNVENILQQAVVCVDRPLVRTVSNVLQPTDGRLFIGR